MFQSIYIEESIADHPTTAQICKRFAHLSPIYCQRYSEIFNRQAQNFRLQKQAPSLILAKKFGNFVLPTPAGYGIGNPRNFYFSHMLNCIYDCRYCFLQGLYPSAHYVIFVNFEEFEQAIDQKIQEAPQEQATFFSGYDCDSLALEPITHFIETFLPFFAKHPQAQFELRTKSTQTQFLLKTASLPNCIVAFSLAPQEISAALEHRTPSLERRLKAIQKLQERDWPIGLRFDPIIYCEGFEEKYCRFFAQVFSQVKAADVHSVSLGPFRLPKGIYKNMVRLYPYEKLFAHSLQEREALVSYPPEIEKKLITFCQQEILKYIEPKQFFEISDL